MNNRPHLLSGIYKDIEYQVILVRDHYCGYALFETMPYIEWDNVEVHGGITYNDDYKVGFDCAHYSDTIEEWNIEKAEQETKNMIDSILELQDRNIKIMHLRDKELNWNMKKYQLISDLASDNNTDLQTFVDIAKEIKKEEKELYKMKEELDLI